MKILQEQQSTPAIMFALPHKLDRYPDLVQSTYARTPARCSWKSMWENLAVVGKKTTDLCCLPAYVGREERGTEGGTDV